MIELFAPRLEELKGNALYLLASNSKDSGVLLKLASTMQRLGVAYHFEKEIEEALSILYTDVTNNLYTIALQFRVLREHSFSISSGDDMIHKTPYI